MNDLYNTLEYFLKLNGYDVKKIKNYLLSHPDFPSLNSIENTFNHYNIENIISEFSVEDFDILPDIFIFSKKDDSDKFYVAKKINKDVVLIISDKKNKITTSAFLKDWSGLIIAVDPLPHNFFKKTISLLLKNIVLLILAVFFLYSILSYNIAVIIFNFLSLLGVFLSVEILKKSIGINSYTLNKFCSNSTEETDNSCSKIINADQFSLFGLKLSDFCLFYFSILSEPV